MQVNAVTEIAAKSNGGSAWGGIIWLLLIVAVVGFLLTSRRRQRAVQQQQSTLAPGSRVITTAGLHGTVVEVDGGDVLLEVAPDVVLRFTRGAVARVLPPEAGDAEHEAIEPSGHDTHGHDTHGRDADGQSEDHHGDGAEGDGEGAGPASGGGPAPKTL